MATVSWQNRVALLERDYCSLILLLSPNAKYMYVMLMSIQNNMYMHEWADNAGVKDLG